MSRNGQTNADGTPETTQLARVAVKPPPFWRTDPALWFLQLDAQFQLGKITADETQYYTTISALDTEVLQSVRDIVLNPAATEKYAALKAKHAESETTKLKQLLQDLQLGDLKPTQLLAKMADLSSNNLSETMLKSLWLNRLSTNTQAILAASSEPLAKLAEMADKIHELASLHQIHQIRAPDPNIAALQQQIEALTQQVAALSSQPRYFRRNRSHSRNRNYQKDRNVKKESSLCLYHGWFEDRARKCVPPCAYKPASEN